LSWQREVGRGGLAVEAIELCGEPEACIRAEAKRLGADYIVVGSHHHGVLHDLLFGGTAAGLLKNAPCPVVIVPAAGVKPATKGSGAEAVDRPGNPSEGRTAGRS
jgi:nucleotide-binding universal stress UspA family protein